MFDISGYDEVVFSSDWHLRHANILKHCSATRRYASINEMDEAIVYAALDVSPDGLIVFLGDFCLNFTAVEEYLPLISCDFLWVLGNHDHAHPRFGKKTEQNLKKIKRIKPRTFVSIQEELVIAGQPVLLSHFPWKGAEDRHDDKHDIWKPEKRKYHPDTFLLCGHRHTSPESRVGNKMMDVGWDGAGKLIPLQEIESIIEEQI